MKRINTNTMDPARLPMIMDAKQVAALLCIDARTVRRKAGTGEIPAHKVGPKLWRFYKKEVLEVLGIETC